MICSQGLHADVGDATDEPILTEESPPGVTTSGGIQNGPPDEPVEVPVESEEGTPVIEKEVNPLPDDVAKNRSNVNWGNIIMAGCAAVVAAVALVLVSRHHGHKSH